MRLGRTEENPRRQQLLLRRIAARRPNRALLRLRRVRRVDACHRSYPAGDAAGQRVWIGSGTERRHRAGAGGLRLTGVPLVQILKMLFDRGRRSSGKARQQPWRRATGIGKFFLTSSSQLGVRKGMVDSSDSAICARLIEPPMPAILNVIRSSPIFTVVFLPRSFASHFNMSPFPIVMAEIKIGVERPDFNSLECLGPIWINYDITRDPGALVSEHERAGLEISGS